MEIISYERHYETYVLLLVLNVSKIKKIEYGGWEFSIQGDFYFFNSGNVRKDMKWKFMKNEIVSDQLLERVEKVK